MIHIFIAYAGEDWQPLADVVLPVWREYCSKHGYVLEVVKGEYQPNPVSFYPFQRQFHGLEYAKKIGENDYLWMCDLDILVTNKEVPIIQFLNEEKSLFFCRNMGDVNSGSYIVKGDIAKVWLQDIVDLIGKSRSDNHAVHLLLEKYKDHIQMVNHPAFNSFDYSLYETIGELTEEEGQWKPGHLLMHLPGCTPDFRTETFKKYINGH